MEKIKEAEGFSAKLITYKEAHSETFGYRIELKALEGTGIVPWSKVMGGYASEGEAEAAMKTKWAVFKNNGRFFNERAKANSASSGGHKKSDIQNAN
jgi:hypothetical protein